MLENYVFKNLVYCCMIFLIIFARSGYLFFIIVLPLQLSYDFLVLMLNYSTRNKLIFLFQLLVLPITYIFIYRFDFFIIVILSSLIFSNIRYYYLFIKEIFPSSNTDIIDFGKAATKLGPLYIHEMSDQIMEHIEKESN